MTGLVGRIHPTCRCGLLVAMPPPTVTSADKTDHALLRRFLSIIVDSVGECHGSGDRFSAEFDVGAFLCIRMSRLVAN